jgi:protein-S-isoprenylcysteine O-methyltransferase Ste14
VRGYRPPFARVWLPAALVLMIAAHLTVSKALSHGGLSAGILLGIAVVAIAAHAGLLTILRRPPAVFLAAIVAGITLNREWPLPLVPPTLWPLGAVLVLGAVSLFLLSFQEFRAAGTSVRGLKPTTTIVRTGPYRFSRNPIYLSFILLVIGLSIWLNNLWLLVTLVPPVVFIAAVVIPREERFLDGNFPEYSTYRAAVRRWM